MNFKEEKLHQYILKLFDLYTILSKLFLPGVLVIINKLPA